MPVKWSCKLRGGRVYILRCTDLRFRTATRQDLECKSAIQDKTGNMLPRIRVGLFVLVLTMVVEPTGAKSVAAPRSRITQANDKLPSEAVSRRIEVSDTKTERAARG